MARCVIYIPGSSQHLFNQSGKIIAERIAGSLQDAIRGQDEFKDRIEVTENSPEYKLDIPVDIAAIKCEVDKQWIDIFKIVEVKYLTSFVKKFADLPVLERGLRALLLAVTHRNLIYNILGKDEAPKKSVDRFQGAYLSAVIVTCIIFLIYWLAVAFLTVLGIESFSGKSNGLSTLAAIVGAVTIFGLSIKSYLEAAERSAIEFYSITRYLDDQHDSSGIINSILDSIRIAREDKDCTNVDVLCFSLGSILACDALFPRRKSVWSPLLKIDNLITIGNPYDLVVSAIPTYFEGRYSPTVEFARWINVYTFEDFLGSNFRIDDMVGDEAVPDLGILTEGRLVKPTLNAYFAPPPDAGVEQNALDYIVPLRRVSNHTLYWDGSDPRAPSCFQEVVGRTQWSEEVSQLLRRTTSTNRT